MKLKEARSNLKQLLTSLEAMPSYMVKQEDVEALRTLLEKKSLWNRYKEWVDSWSPITLLFTWTTILACWAGSICFWLVYFGKPLYGIGIFLSSYLIGAFNGLLVGHYLKKFEE